MLGQSPFRFWERYPEFIVLGCFLVLLLWLTTSMPLSYDDAFNANVAKNLAEGEGFATNYGGPKLLNPRISTGALFLAPLAVPLRLFGQTTQMPMAYSIAANGILLILILWLARKADERLPLAIICSLVMLCSQGKNDIVIPGNTLPSPPWGYFYQFLGNMPGILALVGLGLILTLEELGIKRIIMGCGLALFAVNCKAMHLIVFAAMVTSMIGFCAVDYHRKDVSKGRMRFLISISWILACGFIGAVLQRALAWFWMSETAFVQHVQLANRFFSLTNVTLRLSDIFTVAGFSETIERILKRAPLAEEYLGGWTTLLPVTLLLILTTVTALRRGGSRNSRAGLIFLIPALIHTAWWLTAPGSTHIRHFTPVPVLLATAVAFSVIQLSTFSHRTRYFGILLGLFAIFSSVYNNLGSLSALPSLRAHRRDQITVSRELNALRATSPGIILYGAGWWFPRDQEFLLHRGEFEDILGQSSTEAGVLVVARNLWPVAKYPSLRKVEERCGRLLYERGQYLVLACDSAAAPAPIQGLGR
ncbi:MAG: hypothetical protein DRJ65_06555 [Acidobacteria bacterium]|nr:MAG: hypothetical protein DRJ65_06555 [Acidobacteriota bacterium]